MSKILQVENLVQEFNLTKDFLDKVKFKNGHFSLENRVVHAVNNVSFDVEEGEVFSLVGESGCGKSTTARTIIKLIEPKSGKIIFDGRDITRLKPQEMRPIRREMQMIFQDPYALSLIHISFLRMNVACPRCTLTKALEQMEKAINGLSLQ